MSAKNSKRFPLGALWTNCYVLWDDKNAVVIDPGGAAGKVREFLEQNDLALEWILLTHGHYDHIGGIADLIALSKNGVAIHAADAAMLTDGAQNLSVYVAGGDRNFAKADRLLADGDIVDVGDMRIKVISTPGHTEGSVSFFVSWEDGSALYSGDTLFARSVGRTDLPGGDEHTLMQSLKKLAVFPNSLEVHPGHGPSTTIGDERSHNPYWP